MGVRFQYAPTAAARQIYVKTTRDVVLKDAAWYGRNQVRLCRKHPNYRPHSALAALTRGPWWNRLARGLVLRFPVSPEVFLRGPFWLAERFRGIPAIRRAGIRLLEARQGMVTYRSALAQAGSWKAFRAEFGMRLPVLLYHHVGPPQPGIYPELTISPAKFERQLRWLARQGYRGIRPSDWMAWCREGKQLPDRPVLLTFDDAYADIADYALPVLKQYGFGAAVFVVTGQIGGENRWDQADGWAPLRLMTAAQIREWAAQGIEFGAHSRTHPDLTKLTADRLDEEVAGSGEDLASLLGGKVVSFAYPYGPYSEAARLAAQRAFPLAFTCDEGLNTLSTDPHLLRRTMVLPTDSMTEFGLRVHLGWNPILRLRARLRVRSRAKAVFHWLRDRGR